MNIQAAMQVAQLGVALLTLLGMVFYLGRHSRRVEENTERVEALESSHHTLIERMNRHDIQIAVLEREVLGGENNCSN